MRETAHYYFFWKHQFGQWTLRDITDPDGITFNCCEQYMMYKKAMLFQDFKSADKILKEACPSQQQKLGREAHGYDAALWDQHKLGIVLYGNILKFSQHQDLRKRLLATNDKTLVEASPYDLVWGVGLGVDDDRILDPQNWTGKNLLGQALMLTRASLRVVI